MGDSVPSLKEIALVILSFFMFSLFAISFWTWFLYNISTIIEILVKNIWIMVLFLIAVWIIPSIFVHFIANSLNENVSFERSLYASSLSSIAYILISLIIFVFSQYINQMTHISVISILFIVSIGLLISFTRIYMLVFHISGIKAFKIALIYAFILSVMMASIAFIITFN